jgi:hypothetical protein
MVEPTPMRQTGLVKIAAPPGAGTNAMNLEVIQTVLGIVTFVAFLMAARTGPPPAEPDQARRAASHNTEFIKR